MMTFEEYRSLDATAMATGVMAGEIDPVELLECAYRRYLQVNPQLNAIVTSMFTNAWRYTAKHQPRGKLAGVPMVLKDLLGHFPGVPTSGGSRAFQYVMQRTPSTLVDRLSQQGAVFIGKSNTPEFGLLATTENDAFGATRNPWDTQRTAGGSSGGTAAAVAAGIVPIGTAGDGGGSIRIPASCCGLFGFKPGRGVVPSGPEFAEVWDGAVSEHVLTRTVRDSALVLDVIAGNDPVSHVFSGNSKNGFLKKMAEPPRKLNIGFSSDSLLGGRVDSCCKDAVLQAAQLLESLGHNVEEARPPVDGDDIVCAYTDIYFAHVTADVQRIAAIYGERVAGQMVEPLSYLISRVGQRFSAGDFVNSRVRWVRLQQVMNQYHERYDIWLSPVLADVPYLLGELRASRFEQQVARWICRTGAHRLVPRDILYHTSADQLRKVPFTQLANLTGQPAMSVPLTWSKDGLPIGVQCVGRRGQDALLLQLAYQLEQANPWFDRVPV